MTLLVIVSAPWQGDPSVFARLAEGASHGLVPYRDYPVEYPPLGFVAVALPRLLGGPGLPAYNTIFSIISLALTLATFAAVYWLARRRWSVEGPGNVALMFAGLCLAGVPLVIWRFDIL